MTINAAPNPAYEAWCEEQPTGVEWNGDYIETLSAYPDRKNIWGHHLGQYGGFTRYRGEFDFARYGDCVLDREGVNYDDLRAAHFMA